MGSRTKLKPSSASHSKSRSANGSFRPLNLFKRLNPRHGGSLEAEASGKAGLSAPAAADAATPKPAAAMPLRNSLLEVFMPQYNCRKFQTKSTVANCPDASDFSGGGFQ